MDNKKNGIPKLRFPGFTGAWEQRKWVDSINISNEMVDPTTGKFDDMPHIAPGNIESFTGRILDNVKTVKEEELISGKFLFKPGDVVFGKINPQLGKYFYARVEGLTSADSYVLNGKNKNITQMFIFLLLQTRDFFKYSVSVSKRSGIPKINREELNGFKFLIPCKEEQEKIGDFFLNIDSLITLHQRKLEHLQEQKKGLLQKMFPKNGETVPEVRFPGFTDAWEQRKLGGFLQEYSIKSKIENEYPLLSSTNKGMEYREGRTASESNIGYKILKINDLVLSPQNLWLGNININTLVTGIVSPSYKTLKINNLSLYFLLPQLKTKRMLEKYKQVSVQGASVVRRNLDFTEFMNISLVIPTNKEQEQIGEFFKQLDSLIALHQRKLDHLELMKKGLLQQMFV
ncbi:restriction endonuclease subunit S [Ligilactobacillus salivarius]|uniref:restriction endonuclease subunit S n=1 Tax=Ligilactobacillus salivarius TaxID=1624 RepID=UPI001EF6E692|nr:restriction endonuclease subunit S [Ligilactobacillus salivarius]